MAFTSWMFAVFLIAILFVYYIIPKRFRWILLLLSSYIFYISWVKKYALLLLASSFYVYWVAKKMEKTTKNDKKKWLAVGILPAVGVLFVFKYFNFFSTSLFDLFHTLGITADKMLLDLILPIGISFYTFKLIGYLVDVYKGKRQAEKHFGMFALYVSFFPQIVSGPIARSEDMIPQFYSSLSYDKELFALGSERILLGLFKKVVVANRISVYVSTIYQSPSSYPGLASAVATFFFAVQIYCDFSGYTDMAIGFTNLFGITCKPNFDHPYFSKSIVEFWRRWHISLSSWLRDYIYIPMGGGRVSKQRKFLNVLVTFLVSGLWHGAAWTYVFWGFLHGLLNTVSRDRKKTEKRMVALGKTFITFTLVCITWIFFKASSIGDAFFIIKNILTNTTISMSTILATVLPFTNDNSCVAYFITVCILIFILFLKEWQEVYYPKLTQGKLQSVWITFLVVAVLLYGAFGKSSFIYAQF